MEDRFAAKSKARLPFFDSRFGEKIERKVVTKLDGRGIMK
jgi:hypothetical protein